MKPGMQRDILVAYWLLFDEFEIGEDDPVDPAGRAAAAPSAPSADPLGPGAKPERSR